MQVLYPAKQQVNFQRDGIQKIRKERAAEPYAKTFKEKEMELNARITGGNSFLNNPSQ